MQSFLVLLALAAAVSGNAPVLYTDSPTVVPGQYILVYRANSTKELIAAHAQSLTSAANPTVFEIGDFKGFSAKLSPKELDRMRKSPNVAYIEADQVVTTAQSCQTQKDATWGLDRIDKINADELDDTFTYLSSGGQGVDSYIIDTGILISHNDFEGRASWGTNTVDTQNTDCNGHGTHVAGTVGGVEFGVAKKTTLIAVKVLNCAGSGTNAGVINGINWVANTASEKKRPSVANMSLGGSLSSAVNAAVDAASGAGVVMVVAAGNSQADACKYSPASAPTAISVGATYTDANGQNQIDERASFSNWGLCVSILAPGQNIDSAWIGSNTARRTISGTSMASPHVAGVAAIYFGANPGRSPAQVRTELINRALTGKVTLGCSGLPSGCNSTPNRLLHFTC